MLMKAYQLSIRSARHTRRDEYS